MTWNYRRVKYVNSDDIYITEVYWYNGTILWIDPIDFGKYGIFAEDLKDMMSAMDKSVLVIDKEEIYEI